MTHTPGPWEAKPTVGRIVLNGSSIYGVADITGEFARWNPDDLRLMAAAPELLDACLDLMDIVGWELQEDPNSDELDGMRDAYAMAMAAVAKAQGRTDEE